MPGPVPVPSGQRRRRNAPATPITTGAARPATSPDPDPDWHPLARDWYLSFRESGQVDFFQETDWQTARVAAHILSAQLSSSRPSATAIAEWSSLSTRLLATEGDRRRLRLELERLPAPAGSDAVEDELDRHRARRRPVKPAGDAAGGNA